MNVASRRSWRPLRSFLIVLCVGSVAVAADKTWLANLHFQIDPADWWKNITPAENSAADDAIAPDPGSRRSPEFSMTQLLHGLLYSKPSTGWRLESETTELTSAWVGEQSGGTFLDVSPTSGSASPFFSAEVAAYSAPTTPNAVLAQSGIWTANASGSSWGNSSNWFGGLIADGAGATADFSQQDITQNVIVNLDTSRTIGSLYIGDTNATNKYTISPSSGSTLTFDSTNSSVDSVLQQSSTSAGDTIAADIFVKNYLDINNLSATHAFNITGNIASSASSGAYDILWLNNHDTSTNAAGDINISGNISNGSTGATVALAMIAGGTVTLTGTNSYTGSTEVDGGTLLINGNNSAATGGVFVYNGGTLGGTGTTGSNVNVFGGTITGATATTVGTLTLLGSANFATGEGGGGTYLANLSGALSDLLAITGSMILGADTTLNIAGPADGTSTYVLATFASHLGTFATVTGVPSGYTLVYNPTDLELVPIPEPATWIGGALALGAIAFARRSRETQP